MHREVFKMHCANHPAMPAPPHPALCMATCCVIGRGVNAPELCSASVVQSILALKNKLCSEMLVLATTQPEFDPRDTKIKVGG